ncbi:unnamed protein product [Colletotrichum noveboracense]|uniref:Heterokaryon incompatibility domain-containing protein n=1 Tax=Colletotrichum noveboracense TaxID=2664923 RepID=A0A9W4WJD0_9PEZI|nr:unnamed protein product [Colletotrichum noveboracense]
MADVTTPAYQHTPLPHPESIRILVLHPAEDRDAPIVCSFLDENPILPNIEEWECRAVDPQKCTGDCFYGPIDEELSSGCDGESFGDSAEDSEDALADEMRELAIESIDQASDRHSERLDDGEDDNVLIDGNHLNTGDKKSETSNETDDGLCNECRYDRYEGRHEDEEYDDECHCDCHDDKTSSYNDAQSAASLPKREWHEKVFRPPGFPENEALSYTWGNASDPLPITLGSDGAQIMITRSCYGALRNLRLKKSDRMLWVDAICINQKDGLEKSDQVRVMGRVYAASYRVLIYLGEETPSSRLVFDELAKAGKAPLVLKPM